MAGYKVVVTGAAEQDLFSITGYISTTLKEPAAALRTFKIIRGKIFSLRQMPDRQGLVREEAFARRGVRHLFVGNYTIFYVIDEKEKLVSVIRILYNRREWQHLLEE